MRPSILGYFDGENALNTVPRYAYCFKIMCLLSMMGFVRGAYASNPVPVGDSISVLHTYASIPARHHELPAMPLAKAIAIDVYLPPEYFSEPTRRFPVLYVNDGQDRDAVAMAPSLQRLYEQQSIVPVIVVALSMPPDRMAAYGFSDRIRKRSLPAQTRYGAVGADAHAYAEWLAHDAVAFIDRQYRSLSNPAARTILGWSLGAASAFNSAWNYPDVFAQVGAFSPSFWLRAGADKPLLVQQLIASKPMPAQFALYMSVGRAEETDDRDGDGVIDVLDDAQDVLRALHGKNPLALPTQTLQLVEVPDGVHNQSTWKMMFPAFMRWAYARNVPNHQ